MVLTQSVDYLQLLIGDVFHDPSDYESIFSNNGSDISGGCMVSGFLDQCLQIWDIHILDVPCPTNLGGTYTFQYSLGCNPTANGYENATAVCNQYIDDYSGSVMLSAELEWVNTMCDPLIFEVDGQLSDELQSLDGYVPYVVAL